MGNTIQNSSSVHCKRVRQSPDPIDQRKGRRNSMPLIVHASTSVQVAATSEDYYRIAIVRKDNESIATELWISCPFLQHKRRCIRRRRQAWGYLFICECVFVWVSCLLLLWKETDRRRELDKWTGEELSRHKYNRCASLQSDAEKNYRYECGNQRDSIHLAA